jgi:hypothetical protein
MSPSTRFILSVLLLLGIGLSLPAAAQLPSFIPAAGLRAWYPFTGNTNDSSGFARHATTYGGITYGTDRFGSAGRSLQGNASSATNIPTHNFPTGDAARSAVVYFRSELPYPGGMRQLLAWGNNTLGGRFGLFTTDTSIGLEYAGGSMTDLYFHDTFWHSLIVTYAGFGGTANVSLYLDGAFLSATTTSPLGAFNTDTGTWHNIAGSSYSASYPDSWKGYIDDVAVWDREITYCEVLQLAYNGLLYTAGTITGPDTICIGSSPTLTTIGGTAGTWSSTNPAIATIGSSTGIVTPVSPGLDTIMYITVNTCGSDTAIYPITIFSTAACAVRAGSTITQPASLTVYPNPNHGAFTIRLSGINANEATITITNTLGQLIKELTLPTGTETPIQLNAPPGIYFITANTKEGKLVKNVVVE